MKDNVAKLIQRLRMFPSDVARFIVTMVVIIILNRTRVEVVKEILKEYPNG